jgi:hypothetical protein
MSRISWVRHDDSSLALLPPWLVLPRVRTSVLFVAVLCNFAFFQIPILLHFRSFHINPHPRPTLLSNRQRQRLRRRSTQMRDNGDGRPRTCCCRRDVQTRCRHRQLHQMSAAGARWVHRGRWMEASTGHKEDNPTRLSIRLIPLQSPVRQSLARVAIRSNCSAVQWLAIAAFPRSAQCLLVRPRCAVQAQSLGQSFG